MSEDKQFELTLYARLKSYKSSQGLNCKQHFKFIFSIVKKQKATGLKTDAKKELTSQEKMDSTKPRNLKTVWKNLYE